MGQHKRVEFDIGRFRVPSINVGAFFSEVDTRVFVLGYSDDVVPKFSEEVFQRTTRL